MRKTVTIYGVALVVALVGAYLSWTWESDSAGKTDTGTTIVSVKPADLESVVYEEDELRVALAAKSDDVGDYVWVETRRTKRSEPAKPAASKPDAHDHDGHAGAPDAGAESGADGGALAGAGAGSDAGLEAGPGAGSGAGPGAGPEPAEPAEPTVEVLAFKADQDGANVLERMAPFQALRKLEGASEDRYEAYGLDEPRGTLTLNLAGGKKRTFDVGGEGYGHRNVYVRDHSDDAVYLIEAAAVRPLRHADTRLAEKQPFGWSTNELERLEISDGSNRLVAVQKNRDDRARRMWVPEGADVRNVPLETWVQKFLRVRGTGYATESAAKAPVEKALSVKVVGDKGEPVTVDLLRGQGPNGEPLWYLRSGYSRGMMKIPTPLGSDLSSDFETVVEAVNEGGAETASPDPAE